MFRGRRPHSYSQRERTSSSWTRGGSASPSSDEAYRRRTRHPSDWNSEQPSCRYDQHLPQVVSSAVRTHYRQHSVERCRPRQDFGRGGQERQQRSPEERGTAMRRRHASPPPSRDFYHNSKPYHRPETDSRPYNPPLTYNDRPSMPHRALPPHQPLSYHHVESRPRDDSSRRRPDPRDMSSSSRRREEPPPSALSHRHHHSQSLSFRREPAYGKERPSSSASPVDSQEQQPPKQ